MTAADIQARIDALQAARDAGVLVVKHGLDQVTYQSASEMNATLAKLKAQLAAANGTGRSRVNYIEQTSKGLGHGFDFTRGWR